MPDAETLPVSEADAIAFVTALTPPVSPDLADRAFFGLVSFANDGPRTTTVELVELDSALGTLHECVWTVSGGDQAVAQQPPFVDTPKQRARAMQRVIDGYLAAVEVTATCTRHELTYVCPEPQIDLAPDEQPMDCAETVDLFETPTLVIAVARVGGALKIRGWNNLLDDSGR